MYTYTFRVYFFSKTDSINSRWLTHKTSADPLEAVPAVDEDQAADVLVEGEDRPHRDEAPAKRDSEEVASDHLYRPHHDDAYDYREIDVAGASQRVDSEEVEGSAVFQQDFYP